MSDRRVSIVIVVMIFCNNCNNIMGIPSKFPFVYLRRVWHYRTHKYRVSFSILSKSTSATVHRHLVFLSIDTQGHFKMVADSDIGSYDIYIYKYWYHHGVLRQGFLTFWNQESVKFRNDEVLLWSFIFIHLSYTIHG